jgi:hypothetical protein
VVERLAVRFEGVEHRVAHFGQNEFARRIQFRIATRFLRASAKTS